MAGEFAIASVASYEFKKHNLHIGKLRLWELPFVARTYTHSHDLWRPPLACTRTPLPERHSLRAHKVAVAGPIGLFVTSEWRPPDGAPILGRWNGIRGGSGRRNDPPFIDGELEHKAR